MTIDQFILNLAEVILNPLIRLLFIVALVSFLWGVFVYIRDSESEEGRTTGRRHILWGIIGMAVMAGVFGIIEISTRTVLGG